MNNLNSSRPIDITLEEAKKLAYEKVDFNNLYWIISL